MKVAGDDAESQGPADMLSAAMRRAIVLKLIDTFDMREALRRGWTKTPDDSPTVTRIALAAEALGLVNRSDGALTWGPEWESAIHRDEDWSQLQSMIGLNQTYLGLVMGQRFQREGPRDQLEADPESYMRFLNGVHATNIETSAWLAAMPELGALRYLVDVGGGLGTFSHAWVDSLPDRKATNIDFPEVVSKSAAAERVVAVGADLNEGLPAIATGDVYLLANVIHLFEDWRGLLDRVINAASSAAASILILETNPDTPAGRWFDLQVHIRSGGVSGLIDFEALRAHLQSRAYAVTGDMTHRSSRDPLKRTLRLLVASPERGALG